MLLDVGGLWYTEIATIDLLDSFSLPVNVVCKSCCYKKKSMHLKKLVVTKPYHDDYGFGKQSCINYNFSLVSKTGHLLSAEIQQDFLDYT